MKVKYLVIIEKGGANYSAYSPDIPGAMATGKTVEETIDEMRSVITFHLEGMIENGEELPIPRSLSDFLNETDEISDNDILTSIETDLPVLANV